MTRARVLLVDGDSGFSAEAALHLKDRGYEVSRFADALQAVEYLQEQGVPQVALVNFRLEGMGGLQFAQELKSRADVPIIFIASPDGEDILVDDLTRYADDMKKYAEDFIVKPFYYDELVARLNIALTRMPSIDYTDEAVIQVDDLLSVDFAHSTFTIAGKTQGMTPIESTMLHVLLRNAPRVVAVEDLLARVWPNQDVPVDTLRVHMHRLRRKLENDSHRPHYIRTERGVGYRFTQRPTEISDS